MTKRIYQLTQDTTPSAADVIAVDQSGTNLRYSTLTQAVDAGRPYASQAEAEAGTSSTVGMNPLTTKQAILALGGANFASTAQGALAATATQPGDLSTVATSGDYDDLSNKPTLGTMAAEDSGDYSPIAQALPSGGVAGEVLTKQSGDDYDANWVNAGAAAYKVFADSTELTAADFDGAPPTQVVVDGIVWDYAASEPGVNAVYKTETASNDWFQWGPSVNYNRRLYDVRNWGVSTAASDQAAALQLAVDSGAKELAIDETYRVDTSITLPDLYATGSGLRIVGDGTLDFTNMTATGGSQTPTDNSVGLYLEEVITDIGALTGAVSAGQTVYTMADTTGLSAGDYIYIVSAADWWWNGTNRRDNFLRIMTVDSGTQFTTYDGAELPLTGTPEVYLIQHHRNLKIEGLTLLGNNDTTNRSTGINIRGAKNLILKDLKTSEWINRSIRIGHGLMCSLRDSEIINSGTTGLSYGASISQGSVGTEVKHNLFMGVKHGVTCSGGDLMCRGSNIDGNTFKGCDEQAIDAHQGTIGDTITNNKIFPSMDGSTTGDGINWNGADFVISGNIIDGVSRHGISVMSAVGPEYEKGGIITGNLIKNLTSGSIMITVTYGTTSGHACKGLNITNNVGRSGHGEITNGIMVNASAEDMQSINISQNTLDGLETDGIRVYRTSSNTVNFVSLGSNVVNMSDTGDSGDIAIHVDAGVSYVTVDGNALYRAYTGLRLQGDNITYDSNHIAAAGAGGDILTTGGTNLTAGDNG